jgi:signal transduction histidine kinase
VNNIQELESFLEILDRAKSGDLVVAYHNFLRRRFPGIRTALYYFDPAPDDHARIAGDDIVNHLDFNDADFLRVVYTLPDPGCGYILLIINEGTYSQDQISEYNHTFQLIYNLMQQQNTSANEKQTDLWAGVLSQISHDINSLLHLNPESEEDSNKISIKKQSLEKALPRLLLYVRPMQLNQVIIPFGQLFDAIIDKHPEHDNLGYQTCGKLSNVCLLCDVELIDIAIREVLDNAVFAVRIQGGHINFSFDTYLKNDPVPSQRWLRINISNPSASLPAEFLAEVKSPFFSTWKNQGKSGLGLALADKIIKSHGGMLEIKSDSKHGVQQIIYLPVTESNETA